ncbi:MAG TPA: hypothetical protein VGG22_05920 [Candidatus Baltobacteraceae bacterium]|jgi:hypothetical protein
MRYHLTHHELAICFGSAPIAEIAAPETLVAARFEPVLRGDKGSATLDLHFSREGKHASVACIVVDVAMLEARERDPLVWPESIRSSGIDDAAIAARVEPWLAELLAQGSCTRETWKIFGDESEEARFMRAREAGFLGAAPLEDVARRAAPFVYARRLIRSRDVVIASRDAALGATLLASYARRVRIEGDDALGIAWYGPAIEPADSDVLIVDGEHRANSEAREARVVIDLDCASDGFRIAVAESIPLDSLLDFTQISGADSAFSVEVRSPRSLPEPNLPARDAVGGSTGRILFVLRRGARRFGGADVDHAEAIASAMRDEGFTAGVVDDLNEIAEFQPDLIHAIGLADAGAAAAAQRAAASRGIPFAIHPLYDAAGLGGYWGATVTPYCYRFNQDEASVAHLLGLMRDRRLALNEIVWGMPFHPTNARWEDEVRAVLRASDAIYVGGDDELEAIRNFGVQTEIFSVPPPVMPALEAAAIDALVGSEPYLLLHAPFESTQNQIQAVRAAQIAELPLVLAGPIADAGYASLVRSFAGDRTVVLGEPDAATLEGLYRGAAVYVDVAWVGCGLARAARAVSRGAGLAISARLPAVDLGAGEFLCVVDPGDVESIARGFGNAWYRRQEEAGKFEGIRAGFSERADVREVTRSIVVGYVQALERREQLVAL